MHKSTDLRAAATALVVLVGLVGAACATCYGDTPEVVLDCFSNAYSTRDIVALEHVLGPDYVWVAVSPPEVDVFPREDSIASSLEMFGDPEVESVSLKFREGYEVVEGAEPNTWRIEDLLATLTVKRASMDEPAVVPLCVTLYVRKREGDDPGYEVYREVFFEGDGCVGK